MHYYNLHTHKFTNQQNVLEVVNQYPDRFDPGIPFYSMGIHPWYIDQESVEANLKIIESKLHLQNCLAVGECGLDKRIEIPMEIQVPVFEKQLLLAERYRKPVIVHCVAAFQEVIAIKNKLKISVPMIIHGFSKNGQVATGLTENGFYISFGKYLLKDPQIERVFKNIPDVRFFLETDTMEEHIEEIYAIAAKYKNISLEEIAGIIKTNFNFVFEN